MAYFYVKFYARAISNLKKTIFIDFNESKMKKKTVVYNFEIFMFAYLLQGKVFRASVGQSAYTVCSTLC